MDLRFRVATDKFNRPTIPPGEYNFTLQSVEAKECRDKYSSDPNGTKTSALWLFVADKRAPNGNAYEYEVWTGTDYGDKRAKLTLLMDMLVPNITEATFLENQPESLVGKRFKGLITHKPGESGPKAAHVYLIPSEPDSTVGDNSSSSNDGDEDGW